MKMSKFQYIQTYILQYTRKNNFQNNLLYMFVCNLQNNYLCILLCKPYSCLLLNQNRNQSKSQNMCSDNHHHKLLYMFGDM